jgi:hypothetical protein
MTAHPGRRPCVPPLLMGLVLLAVGAVFLLNNLGIYPAERALRHLPAVLIVVGMLKVLGLAGFRGPVLGTVFTAIGTWWLLENLGVITIDFGTALARYWPAILVLVGLALVSRALRRGNWALRQPRSDPGARP